MTAVDTGPAGLVIGGDRITTSSGATHEHIYPATGQPNASVVLAGRAEFDVAIASAREAQREWVALTVDRRRDLLIALADCVQANFAELSALNVHDYAVPISMAATSVLLERFLRYFAGYADKPHGSNTPVTGSFDVNLVEREHPVVHERGHREARFITGLTRTVDAGSMLK